MDFENKHGRDVNGLEEDKLNRVNGSHREGSWLFVSVMKLMKILVEKRCMENAMTPIS